MRETPIPVQIGETRLQQSVQNITGEVVSLFGESFYKISHFDAMPPFLMSLVSSSNHWLYVASTGGLSAGRVNAEQALFPYYTVDKLTENSENTGPKTIFLTERGGKTHLWEPLSPRQRGIYAIECNLYKNIPSTALVFEEINHSLGLTYRYAWRTSDTFGFVKTSWLRNDGDSDCCVELLDGFQNLLPANVAEWTQTALSPLLDAYKHNELDPQNGLGIYKLNSALTDLAEPRESLLATVAWQLGLDARGYLLSSRQLDRFRAGENLQTETEVRGQRGAYFAQASIELAPGELRAWHLAADVSQDAAAIVHLTNLLRGNRVDLAAAVDNDLAANTACLKKIVSSADGIQVSQRQMLNSHHFANVMFNEMRGGYFPDPYAVHRADFMDYVASLNRTVLAEQEVFFKALPTVLPMDELQTRAQENGSIDLIRMANAYLPLYFSRRHGDPSRPWNRFSINIKKADGSQQLNYEGNWRDIFQNWEALAYSYPEYTESMICAFLNATTIDGYNPYRITRSGIDWELPEPDNPWANIGYWSDHQIIYLLKLMELSAKAHPRRLQSFLARPVFSYANVPYRIKTFPDVVRDPHNTIAFDWQLEETIRERVQKMGSDGKLVQSENGQVVYATLTEKLLTLLLAKLVNFVPEGGIWMNTQRPEWNDANNALVGKGLSLVTLAYLRRYIVFVHALLQQNEYDSLPIHTEVGNFISLVTCILAEAQPILQGSFTDGQRRALIDELGQAGSDYRWNVYQHGFTGQIVFLPLADLNDLLHLALRYIDHTLRANRRSDNLYHAYNILHLEPGKASVSPLYEMLEGQVAILSSALLSGAESLALLESLRHGPLYRADQHSYLLYPDRAIPGFLTRNHIPSEQVADLPLVNELVRTNDQSLLVRDENGDYHFAGHIHNRNDIRSALETLKHQAGSSDLVARDGAQIEALFENLFHHDQFTGRSGTFFAYEGLGSIYWHMVSKLVLAVQETILRTQDEPSTPRLLDIYADLRRGQCFNKTPAEYGAFPTDPYSHTPGGRRAMQPGMTGLVKEEILIRQNEMGIMLNSGCLDFNFRLFDPREWLQKPAVLSTWDVFGQPLQMAVPAGSLAYSFCQVPVILQKSKTETIQIYRSDGSLQALDGSRLDRENSKHIFKRDGVIHHLVVSIRAVE